MVSNLVSRRFRIETCVAFTVVASIAVAYFQLQRMQAMDAEIASVYSGYILASGLLGYCFAPWYGEADAGWFETVCVPLIISLLATVFSTLPLLALGAMTGHVPNPYSGFLGAMLFVFVFILITGPFTAATGIVTSIALGRRAKAASAP